MNIAEILQIIQAITALIDSLQKLGINFSGVQMHTSTPLDLSGLLSRFQPPNKG